MNSLILSGIGEIVKMSYGDYLSNHVDGFHKIQAVLYLTSLSESEGGIFIYKDIYRIIPSKGDLLLFQGNNIHMVTTVFSKKDRYSITFGFNSVI